MPFSLNPAYMVNMRLFEFQSYAPVFNSSLYLIHMRIQRRIQNPVKHLK